MGISRKRNHVVRVVWDGANGETMRYGPFTQVQAEAFKAKLDRYVEAADQRTGFPSGIHGRVFKLTRPPAMRNLRKSVNELSDLFAFEGEQA
jgi:hypothetical protein